MIEAGTIVIVAGHHSALIERPEDVTPTAFTEHKNQSDDLRPHTDLEPTGAGALGRRRFGAWCAGVAPVLAR
jgi:hypothetical protein